MNGHSASQNFCPSASSQFQQQSPEQLLQVYGYECYGPSIKKIRQRYANRNENSHKLITAINKNCQATEPANARRLLLQLVDIGRMHHAACSLHQHTAFRRQRATSQSAFTKCVVVPEEGMWSSRHFVREKARALAFFGKES